MKTFQNVSSLAVVPALLLAACASDAPVPSDCARAVNRMRASVSRPALENATWNARGSPDPGSAPIPASAAARAGTHPWAPRRRWRVSHASRSNPDSRTIHANNRMKESRCPNDRHTNT